MGGAVGEAQTLAQVRSDPDPFVALELGLHADRQPKTHRAPRDPRRDHGRQLGPGGARDEQAVPAGLAPGPAAPVHLVAADPLCVGVEAVAIRTTKGDDGRIAHWIGPPYLLFKRPIERLLIYRTIGVT